MSAARPAPIAAADVRVSLGGRRILHGVDLAVESGSWHAVLGPNGAGKSTLLRALAGLLPHEGEIRIGGDAIAALAAKARARLVAYLPQQPQLPGDMTVSGYVLLGRMPYLGYFGLESAGDRSVAAAPQDRLDHTGVPPPPHGPQCGGEPPRLVHAPPRAQQARVLLLDEPTTALDLGHQQQVLDLVDELRIGEGLTVVSTLHDLSVAAQYADEMTVRGGGKAVARGGAAEVLTEDRLAAYYGARVKVFDDGSGRPVVHLVR